MKINEVDELVGIGKKAIRFYEQEGLLSPSRNPQNGYRDYSEDDVQQLLRIKLLRKLGLPISEIRKMQLGQLTLADGMERHIISLQREHKNIEMMTDICKGLSTCNEKLENFNPNETLQEINSLEEGGTTFMDKQLKDRKKTMIYPIITAAIVTIFMLALIAFFLWAFHTDPTDAPPLFLILTIFISMPIVTIIGIITVTRQRVKEIIKGELDEASKY